MREKSSLFFETEDSQFKHCISYYARDKSFTTGGVGATIRDWNHFFNSHLGLNVTNVFMKNGLQISDSLSETLFIRHLFRRRVLAFPLNFKFLKRPNTIVYLHEGWTLSNIVLGIICKFKRVPYVVMPHGVYDPSIIKGLKCFRLRLILEKFLLKHASFVHVYFKGELNHIKQLQKKAKIKIFPTGISKDLRRGFYWSGSSNYFLYAGRLDPHFKSLDLLIHAWKILDWDTRLILAGPDYNGGRIQLESLVDSLEIRNKVIFTGELTQSELLNIMSCCRGFLHPSRWECYGRSAVESIARGVPTLISYDMQLASIPNIDLIAWITRATAPDIAESIYEMSKIEPESFKLKFDAHQDILFDFLNWSKMQDILVSSYI